MKEKEWFTGKVNDKSIMGINLLRYLAKCSQSSDWDGMGSKKRVQLLYSMQGILNSDFCSFRQLEMHECE